MEEDLVAGRGSKPTDVVRDPRAAGTQGMHRLSDAEREQVVERLHEAVREGRLTLAEFEERVDGVLAARTDAQLEPYLADLPAAQVAEVVRMRARSSKLRRTGRWRVPRRIVVESQSSTVKLDFVEAVISSAAVQVDIDIRSTSLTLVLPPGASADAGAVTMESSSGSTKVAVDPGRGPHFVVAGRLKSSRLTVRYQRRLLRWRW